jgi:uroporphyrinogen decarboxylase
MTKHERFERTSRLQPVDRPPFVPAVYEHKAALVGRTPSDVARDPDLLLAALRRELALYDPDILTVGVDVYNVEAEALGCEVRFFEAGPDVPAVAGPLLRSIRDARGLEPPDPERSGRMPLFVEVAAQLVESAGADMPVRGAVTGPFSLASALAGTAELLVAALDEPAEVRDLLALCGRISVAYGRAFLRRGAGVALFDSKASPSASSPRLFRELVLPVYRDVVMPGLRAAGARHIPLIIGGDTTPIVDDLIATGATQLLCDWGADLEVFTRRCLAAGRALRASVDARLVHHGDEARIREAARGLLARAGRHPGFFFGCGVVAYDTPASHVLALREALDEFALSLPISR